MPGSRFCVAALNALQNSMKLSPRCPSAGPIGGEGFALPAGTCNFIIPTTFFAIHVSKSRRQPPLTPALSPRAGRGRDPRREGEGEPRLRTLHLLDLGILQLHGGSTPEDRNGDL